MEKAIDEIEEDLSFVHGIIQMVRGLIGEQKTIEVDDWDSVIGVLLETERRISKARTLLGTINLSSERKNSSEASGGSARGSRRGAGERRATP